MARERWKQVKEDPYRNYEVSDQGRVRNGKTGYILKPSIDAFGYPIVGLCHSGISKTRKVHKLVSEAFIDGNHDGLVIDHKDGDKTNNKLSNLEYCTSSENNRRAYALGLKQPAKYYNQPTSRKVKVVETGKIYDSINECARAIGGNHRHIGECLNGKLKKHHGYHFEEVF